MYAAIFSFVWGLLFYVTAAVAMNIMDVQKPSVRSTVQAIFFLALPFRIMNLLFLRLWHHLVMENMDLDRTFHLVSRDPAKINVYHQWVLSFR